MRIVPIVWRTPPAGLRLTDNIAHVWCAELNPDDSRLEQLLGVLSPDEKERADRFLFKRHRRRYIVGRGILRNLLSQYLNTDPRSIEFSYSPRGKPFLKHQPIHGDLFFNLSHSHELALYVIAPRPLVGIDVEYLRPMSDIDGIARHHFSPNEYNNIRSMAEDEKCGAFLNYWTCKEAYVKATGEGLSDLDNIEVVFDSAGNSSLKKNSKSGSHKQDWLVKLMQPKIGYSAALALSGRHWQLNYFSFIVGLHVKK